MHILGKYVDPAAEIRRYTAARFPIGKWLPKYTLNKIVGDLLAGLTIGMMVVPQALAYAKVADLPAEYGLYSSFMGPFLYVVFGTAKDVTLGPTAIMSLLVASTLSKYPASQGPALAIAMSFMGGITQLLMGLFGLGFLVYWISYPVVSGFTSAAAITIATGQIPHIFGIKARRPFYEAVYDICAHIKYTRPFDALLGIISLVLLVVVKHYTKKVAGKRGRMRVLWIFGTARNAILVIVTGLIGWGLSQQGFNCPTPPAPANGTMTNGTVALCPLTLIGPMPAGLPKPEVPDLSPGVLGDIGAGIIVVALIGFLESIAIGKSFAKANKYTVDPSQELVAIGLGNIAGSFFSAYPVTGSFSRTAVNSQSGVRTPLGGLFTGIVVIISLVALTPSFQFIPSAALAAIIISAVVSMFDPRSFKALWRVSFRDFSTLVVTFLAVLFLGVEYGMILAILFTLLIALYYIAKPPTSLVGELPAPGSRIYVPLNDFPLVKPPSGVLVFRLDGHLLFPSANHFQESLADLEDSHFCPSSDLDTLHVSLLSDRNRAQSTVSSLNETEGDGEMRPLQGVVLDMTAVGVIDVTGARMIDEVLRTYRTRNIPTRFAACRNDVRAILTRYGIVSFLGRARFHVTVAEAVDCIQRDIQNCDCGSPDNDHVPIDDHDEGPNDGDGEEDNDIKDNEAGALLASGSASSVSGYGSNVKEL